jgi:cytochrome c peroxidase
VLFSRELAPISDGGVWPTPEEERMPPRVCRLSPVVVVCLLLLGAGRATPEAGPILLAQATPAATADKVAKGKALFSDTALSGDDGYSCAKCHPDNGHTDNKTYVGVDVVNDGDPKGRSTPTLWGVGTRAAYSWAGTAPSLQANIRGIIVNRMKAPSPPPR